jgi:hypothetical protein
VTSQAGAGTRNQERRYVGVSLAGLLVPILLGAAGVTGIGMYDSCEAPSTLRTQALRCVLVRTPAGR